MLKALLSIEIEEQFGRKLTDLKWQCYLKGIRKSEVETDNKPVLLMYLKRITSCHKI